MTAMADDATVVPVQVRWNPALHARVSRLADRLHVTRTAAFHILVSIGLEGLEGLSDCALQDRVLAAKDA